MRLRRARALASIVLGGLSLVGGFAINAPTNWSRQYLSRFNIAISEVPWLPAALGLLAVNLNRGSRRPVGRWLGVIGAALALRPTLHLIGINARLDQAMRDGLGADWERVIPPQALEKAVKGRFTLIGTIRRARAATAQVKVETDIQYGLGGDVPLLGDLYTPRAGAGPFPAIIHIHGGSWTAGRKGDLFVPQCRWLAAQGYVVFDINYRLSPAVLWPEHLADVKTAIRWIRANATRLNIDPDRLALIGKSAGAHLALMAAYTPGASGPYAHNGDQGRDDVQAVIGVYPPTDLVLLQKTVDRSLSAWLGRSLAEDPALYANASPIHAASAGSPPTLLAHGGNDNLVVPAHSENLFQRLRALGVPAAYLFYPWGRHGFDYSLFVLGGHMLQYDIDRFLAWALRPGRM